MAALTAARNTPRKLSPLDGVEEYPIAASTTIYQGSIVALNAGNAVPGATATGRQTVGRARKTYVNSGAAGAFKIEVETGVFKYTNSGADAVDADDVGKVCWVVDDQTVAETDGTATRSACGIVKGLDSDGVWVQILNGQRLT